MIYCRFVKDQIGQKMVFFDEILGFFDEKMLKSVKVRVRNEDYVLKRTFDTPKTVKSVKVRVSK